MILAHIGDVRSLFDLVGFQEGNRDADIDPPCKRAARKAFYLIFRGKKNGAPEVLHLKICHAIFQIFFIWLVNLYFLFRCKFSSKNGSKNERLAISQGRIPVTLPHNSSSTKSIGFNVSSMWLRRVCKSSCIWSTKSKSTSVRSLPSLSLPFR